MKNYQSSKLSYLRINTETKEIACKNLGYDSYHLIDYNDND